MLWEHEMKKSTSFCHQWRSLRLAAFSCLSIFVAACSVVSVKKPPQKNLVLPQKEGGTGFGLSGETPSGLYRGGLILWSQQVTAPQISALLNANRLTNEKYVALNRYFTSFMEKDVEPRRQRVAEMGRQYAQAQIESEARVAPLQRQRAAEWFQRETEGLQTRHGSFNAGRANDIFNAYCEAKIIDLATRPYLVKFNYRTRPTPSALCETYYRGRFFTGETCADSAQGRNYYDCLWQEGVAKTRFASRLQIRSASRRSGTRTSEAVTLLDFANTPTIRNALALSDVPFCTASDVRRTLLSGVRYRVLSTGVLLGGLSCGENSRYEISYGAGDWDQELANASAGFLMEAIEVQKGGATVPASFRWLDPALAGTTDALKADVDALAEKISLFHSPSAGCALEFNSPNDVFFNEARQAQQNAAQGSCKSALPAAASLPDILVADVVLEEQRKELENLQQELASLKGNSCPVAPSCEAAPAGHARCDFLNAQVKKAAAAEARGVASVLVTDFALSFDRVAPAASAVTVWINGAAAGVGCLGEMQSGACSTWLAKPEFESAQQISANVSSNGELVIQMKMDTKRMSAAGVPESVVRQFLPFHDLVLELNATVNKLENLVPYMSGKAFVRASAESKDVLTEGSVSYLIENSFDKRLGEFCSNF
ncbi:MAG: hypothetical protein RIR26_635 [Pseudomonadota bacterium]|jgi:hypothetical protein